MMLIDAKARESAIRPDQSFIVQAPAGSGKTELLTQRFLKLLSTVQQPEEIIALTFTKKAASEMQERILKALIDAQTLPPPESPHQAQTYQFAKEALLKDEQYGWSLTLQPHRLRVMTIDALCQSIAKAIPLLQHPCPYTEIMTHPTMAYRQAVREALLFSEEHETLQSALKIILKHCDNRRDQLVELLTELLSQRSLWLTPLLSAKNQSREWLEAWLAHIEAHALAEWKSTLSEETANTLLELLHRLAEVDDTPNSPRVIFRNCIDFNTLGRIEAEQIAKTLLTTQNGLRNRFDHHVGLKKGNCPEPIFQSIKSESQALLETLKDNESFVEALIKIKSLPQPTYQDHEWETLEALFQLLPIVVAHLHLIFNEEGRVDFGHVSTLALEALGTDEAPTDLGLYLDYQLRHLLIDEFQDTSIEQFHLISKLVRGFEPGDGRTLFLVGDPMQSIYRFRQAEVGLFLRAKQQGVGPVELTSLELKTNFRSNHTLVEWVNQHFCYIFPKIADLESGAIDFHASKALHIQGHEQDIQALEFSSKEAEAHGIVECIQETLSKSPHESIAILVRTRGQLTHIIAALKKAEISFQGIDLDPLQKAMHIQDLHNLTQILLQPAHRLAWLSFLRSPMGGFSLSELLILSTIKLEQSLFENLADEEVTEKLNIRSQTRAKFIFSILHKAYLARYQIPLSEWLLETFMALGGLSLYSKTAIEDMQTYFELIDEFALEGTISDWQGFEQAIQALYAKPSTNASVQIMTIHKSKGLEFDTVIIPALSSKGSSTNQPLIRWLNFTTSSAEGLLISPMRAKHELAAPIYEYIGQIETEKGLFELQRLLYVAVTRAKKRLYLCDHKATGPQGSFRTLLAHQTFEPMHSPEEPLQVAHVPLSPVIALSADSLAPLTPTLAQISPYVSKTTLSSPLFKHLGTLTHLALEWLCTTHQSLEHFPWEMFKQKFLGLGYPMETAEELLTQMKNLLIRFINCPIGQWISQSHAEEANELPLLTYEQGDVVTKIIDRTFIEHDTRWIIDFKTGDEASQAGAHFAQLYEYAMLFSQRDSRPIMMGLYYLTTNRWKTFEYSKGTMTSIPL